MNWLHVLFNSAAVILGYEGAIALIQKFFGSSDK
jgi:hypothetical protein